MSFKYNKNNPVAKYLVEKMMRRNPDDSLFAMAKRTGVNAGTLHNAFNSVRNWQQSVMLMQICADLGISMEEALTQDPVKYDANQEIKHWRELYFKEKLDKETVEKELKILKKDFDKMKSIISKPRE